jgi:hypothetical protein
LLITSYGNEKSWNNIHRVSGDVGLSAATSTTLVLVAFCGTLKTIVINWMKTGMTSNQHAPYTMGYIGCIGQDYEM